MRMIKSDSTVRTPLSTAEHEMMDFEKLGFNRKFLETETGRALSEAISLLQLQAGNNPRFHNKSQDAPEGQQSEVAATNDVKD